MHLKQMLEELPQVDWERSFDDHPISMISCDSREEQPGALFIAMSGSKYNGSDFIKEAIAKGAVAIAHEGGRSIGSYQIPDQIAVVTVHDPRRFLRQVTGRFYGQPSTHVHTIGITGTNGKTTITYLLESIFHANSQRCGVIGTINYRIGNEIIPSKNTTPGYLENQRLLHRLMELKVPYCIMETSSHALSQGRVEGIDFAAAVFTNLTQDHLDYHKDMEAYFEAKSLLFTRLSANAGALINIDDEYGRRLVSMSSGKVMTYGIDRPANVQASNIHYSLDGTTFDMVFPSGTLAIRTKLIGKHNVYNILSAASCAYTLGFGLSVISQGIEALTHVPGRLEAVETGRGIFVFIDYAHTEDGLVNVLKSLRAVSRERIITVFGCGGDRDKTKRPKMGKVVSELSDHAIVTSDNPRSEDPHDIIGQILTGFAKKNFDVCVDRKEAIALAIKSAVKGNIVLLAGKGHEDYQVLKDKTIAFDERKIVKEIVGVCH